MTEFHRLIDRICAHSNDAAHGVEIPAGSRLLFTNGQVGLRPYGKVPTDTRDQIEKTARDFNSFSRPRT